MTYMPTLREVIKVDGVYYVEVDIVLRERGRLCLGVEIKKEGVAIMECEHCGEVVILDKLEDVDKLIRFFLCEKCIRKGKVDAIIDDFQVKKACNVGFGAINPDEYDFVADRK